ncbi:DUF1837 domain-containing protein [Dysgonomonas sp. 521]|uniref:HamA C-terminal domain-containing protein n=1 Tax=Dysgonomonas sp. 521 TaxID=2302932 RepID=UPI0013D23F48|nr:DUF1837 domain-containing protein [Dysgonomonas sp. 521]NDV96494.1 DUF1837 domain-containing protein [Dysgonomonas sp. 521]
MDRIDNALDHLFVKSKGEINSRIEQISFNVDIADTQAKAYCHCLKTDANGNLRVKDLVDFIDTKIVEYAIPKKEIDEAKKYFIETNSPSKIDALKKKAKGLFTDLEKTGEGGEILLYILVQEFLKLPQLISKMSLKTSGKLHYQGADGIHVKYDIMTGFLNLYWAEAKMYQNLNDAITKCFESLKGFLLDPQGYGTTQERDIQLITSNITSNINNPELEDMLVRYFDKDDDLSNNVVYKGICFIGFDCDKYPSEGDLTKTTMMIKSLIETEHHNWYEKLSDKIKAHVNLETKEIHVFLMPFPSVAQFRKYYIETIQ